LIVSRNEWLLALLLLVEELVTPASFSSSRLFLAEYFSLPDFGPFGSSGCCAACFRMDCAAAVIFLAAASSSLRFWFSSETISRSPSVFAMAMQVVYPAIS
jgi:hypothetical protein